MKRLSGIGINRTIGTEPVSIHRRLADLIRSGCPTAMAESLFFGIRRSYADSLDPHNAGVGRTGHAGSGAGQVKNAK